MPEDGKRPRPRGRPFEKGRSGNPRGRPRKRLVPQQSAMDVVLDRQVFVPGENEPLTLPEAARLRTFQDALDGKARAMRKVLGWYEKWDAWERKRTAPRAKPIELVSENDPRNLDTVLQLLDIVRLNETREPDEYSPHLLLKGWAVEAALARRRRTAGYTDQEWAEVVRCTEPGAKIKRPKERDDR